MMPYRNTKVKIRSRDWDTGYFGIVTGVLYGDTLAPYRFIICLVYVFRTSIDLMKDNGFKLTNERSRIYTAQAITDADDIAVLANTPTQAETRLYSVERAAAGIGLLANAEKTEYMCFKQRNDITTLKGGPLKLIEKFTYLGSIVSLTEKDINMRLAKAWTAYNRLSDLTDKIKRIFFQATVVSVLLYGCTTWMLNKSIEKKHDGNYTRMLQKILNKSWWQHPTK